MDFSLIWAINTEHGAPERHHETLEQVQLCEEVGFDCVWFTEHHFEDYGRPCPDLLAAYAAAVTSRIAIGTAVIVLPWHNPIDIAERVATLDHLTRGRLRAGFGRGNQPHEFYGLGIPLEEARPRFDQALDIVLGLWTNDTFSYESEFWKVEDVRLLPKPLQRPHPPVYQPALSDSTVKKIVARGINGLIGPYLTPYEVLKERYFDVWNEACAEAGRGDLHLAHNEFVYVAETDEQAYEEAKDAATWYPKRAAQLWGEHDTSKMPPDFAYLTPILEQLDKLTFDEVYNDLSLIGSPERVIPRIRFLEEAGVDELMLFTCMGPQITHEKAMKSIELFGRHVIPEFKKGAPAKAEEAVGTRGGAS